MKVFIVVEQDGKGHKTLADVGKKMYVLGTKEAALAEEAAKKCNGQIYSILVDDTLRLVSNKARTVLYKEARRIGALETK